LRGKPSKPQGQKHPKTDSGNHARSESKDNKRRMPEKLMNMNKTNPSTTTREIDPHALTIQAMPLN
jgi:hypothetical protein